MKLSWYVLLAAAAAAAAASLLSCAAAGGPSGEQPLARIAIHRAEYALDVSAYVKVSPRVLGLQGQNSESVTLKYSNPHPSVDDWIGVFSPANFSSSICEPDNLWQSPPLLCTAPIKVTSPNGNTLDHKENVAVGEFGFITSELGYYLAYFKADTGKKDVGADLVLDWKIGPKLPRSKKLRVLCWSLPS